MAYYSFGQLRCSNCGRKMQMTVVTLDEDRYGGTVIEFGCTNCSETVALPLNLESMKGVEAAPNSAVI